jgi:hypothetical protein
MTYFPSDRPGIDLSGSLPNLNDILDEDLILEIEGAEQSMLFKVENCHLLARQRIRELVNDLRWQITEMKHRGRSSEEISVKIKERIENIKSCIESFFRECNSYGEHQLETERKINSLCSKIDNIYQDNIPKVDFSQKQDLPQDSLEDFMTTTQSNEQSDYIKCIRRREKESDPWWQMRKANIEQNMALARMAAVAIDITAVPINYAIDKLCGMNPTTEKMCEATAEFVSQAIAPFQIPTESKALADLLEKDYGIPSEQARQFNEDAFTVAVGVAGAGIGAGIGAVGKKIVKAGKKSKPKMGEELLEAATKPKDSYLPAPQICSLPTQELLEAATMSKNSSMLSHQIDDLVAKLNKREDLTTLRKIKPIPKNLGMPSYDDFFYVKGPSNILRGRVSLKNETLKVRLSHMWVAGNVLKKKVISHLKDLARDNKAKILQIETQFINENFERVMTSLYGTPEKVLKKEGGKEYERYIFKIPIDQIDKS